MTEVIIFGVLISFHIQVRIKSTESGTAGYLGSRDPLELVVKEGILYCSAN